MSMNQNTAENGYTASDALNDALVKAGVSYIFINSGTDYPPIIESWAKSEIEGRPKPEIIIMPQELVGMSAAHGYAQITGEPQAVFVHVDVGTQSLGGAVHNAFRSRIPVFILAGISPYTMEGELKGGRTSQIQFIQNTSDQASIVREYSKLNYEFRTGKNIQQMLYRMLQLSKSDPAGPVYAMASREVLEEEGWDVNEDMALWEPISPTALDADSLKTLAEALQKAENPLIITSYLGRNKDSVAKLVSLSDKLAIPVVEMLQTYMNFPGDHPMHLGFEPRPFLKDADLILVLDCDLPWMPAAFKPSKDCRVFYIDIDPIKEKIPLWHIPAEKSIKADTFTALTQLNTKLESDAGKQDNVKISARRQRLEKLHFEQRENWKKDETQQGEQITPAFLTACIREIIDEDTIVLAESQTNRVKIDHHLPRNKPGTFFQNGGSSLGWHGGAAIGMKLACPDKEIIALTGDGSYIFSGPTAVYWMAMKYKTPFMTVIYNNQGWTAPKSVTKGQHPDGYAVKNNLYWANFDPPARLDLIAEAAGGAFAKTVSDPADLKSALLEGQQAVRNGIPAVINVMLPPG